MRTTYHKLVGLEVIDAAGKRVGRVADLWAESVDDRLRVTGLLVGESELLSRLGLKIVELVWPGALPGYFVPWRTIAGIDKEIRLSVGKESLERWPRVGRIGNSA